MKSSGLFGFRAVFILTAVVAVMLHIAAAFAAAGAYFPAAEFGDLGDRGEKTSVQFSRILATLDEPVLFKDASKDFSARLTTMGSRESIVVRIEKRDGGITVHVKEFDGRDMRVVVTKKRSFSLKRNDFEQLTKEILRRGFWSADNKQSVSVSGGEEWVVEVNDQGKYRALYSWGPQEGAAYEVGQALLKTIDTYSERRAI